MKIGKKFDGKKYHSNQKWNGDNCRCECKQLIKYLIKIKL